MQATTTGYLHHISVPLKVSNLFSILHRAQGTDDTKAVRKTYLVPAFNDYEEDR
jgi:hypothetical protein